MSSSGSGVQVLRMLSRGSRKWLPRAEGFVLPDATHLLHVEHPRAVAEALTRFFGHHPVATR